MRAIAHRITAAVNQAGGMAWMKPPMTSVTSYRGMPYELDLLACRRALVQCQVEGEFDSMERLAEACGISRSTASRFFSGRHTSLTATLKIAAALHLGFEDIARPVVGE
jgi:Helix-turn-helix